MNNWARLGIILLVLAIFCVIATEVFSRYPDLYPQKKIIAGCLAGAGTVLWVVGKVHCNNEDTTRKPGFFTLRLCGSILAASAGIVTNIIPISQLVASPRSILQAASIPRLPQFIRRDSVSARQAREGGLLKVQGIFYREHDPSAIINGQTVMVGDRVGRAKVVAIERQSVTVEIAQERKVLNF